ncbi:toxin biosynthesis protein [Daldinia childiae]|uniref:toxin biosynthesis protein n=1 Tax=Daldinia childiae TaxID=326645 RepID=UPI001444C2D3|nr:toxin biosynthesis protein [Daldinia childiae]KAF3058427.1 toxin biosynthesis protein [Daldinia childiae]
MNSQTLPTPQLADRGRRNDIFPDPIGSITPYILLYVVQLVALASPKFPLRRFLFSGILLGLLVQTQTQPPFTNEIGLAQLFCIQWSFLLATLEKILLSGEEGPESHFWREKAGEKEAESYPAFSLRKLHWALMLIVNQRGIGWNHQVKNVPQVVNMKRSVFLRRQLFHLVKSFLLADLCFNLGIRFFYTNPETGIVGDINSKYITMNYACPGWRVTTVLVFAATPYFALSTQYALGSIVFVGLGLNEPEDWPPLFNPISEATTVRNLWGKYWHQVIRRALSTWSSALVDALGIQHGTNLSSYTQLWFSFVVSGYFHARSHLILPSPINVTVAERAYPIFYFFVLQATAITFEDFVKWAWCKGLGMGEGESRWRKTVGYLWVTGWLVWSVKFPALAYLKTRVGTESPFPFTIVGPWTEIVPMPI